MEYIQLKGTSLTASRVAFGCMRLAELSVEQAKRQSSIRLYENCK